MRPRLPTKAFDALRAVATAVVALACVAGCSAEPSEPAGDAGKADKAESSAAPVPSEIRLAGALANKTDVRGYRLEDNDQPAVRPKADREECRPLADMTGSGVDRTPAAKAWSSRSYGSTTERGLAVTTSLFSYEGDGAATTLACLSDAECDTPRVAGNPVVFGGPAGYSFKGNLDELRIYDRGLSAAEVAALYSGATGCW